MKQCCISSHLHISILLCNSASLYLNFLLDVVHEYDHLHMSKRSSVWGKPSLSFFVFGYVFVYSSFALGTKTKDNNVIT